ncbi:MAG: hypothetical protein ACI4L8_06345 [Candidatus Fimadaptatus sp.]
MENDELPICLVETALSGISRKVMAENLKDAEGDGPLPCMAYPDMPPPR